MPLNEEPKPNHQWMPNSYVPVTHLSKKLSKLADTPSGEMISKLDKHTYMSEFESHCVTHLCSFVSHLSKKLCKLSGTLVGVIICKLD